MLAVQHGNVHLRRWGAGLGDTSRTRTDEAMASEASAAQGSTSAAKVHIQINP